MDHEILLRVAKYYGLIYLIILSIGVLVFVFWPGNKERFDKAADSIVLDIEDKPGDGR